MATEVLRKLGIEIDMSGDGSSMMDKYAEKVERTHKMHGGLGRAIDKSERIMGSFGRRIGMTSNRMQFLTRATQFFQNGTAKARSFVARLKAELKQLNPSLSKTDSLLKGVAATALLATTLNIGKGFVGASAEYEKAHTSMSVFLGSAEKATDVMQELNKFSLKTPFEPKDVIASGKSLLAFGYTAEKLPKTLQMIGDVAAATDIPFKELSQIMGKMKTSVYVQAEELNQLTGRGINAYKELAKVLGTSETQIKSMASKNMIQYKHLEKAFENMTSKGGQFFGMMGKLAETSAGKWSTFMGFVGEMQRQLGDFIMLAGKPILTLLNHFLFWLTKNKWAMFAVKMILAALVPLIGIAVAGALFAAAQSLGLFNMQLMKTYFMILKPLAIVTFFALAIEDLIIWMAGGKSVIGEWIGPWSKVGWAIKVLVIGALVGLIALAVFFFGWIPVAVGVAIGAVVALWKIFASGPGVLKSIWKDILSFFGKAWKWLVKTATKYGRFVIIAIFPLAALYYYWSQIDSFMTQKFGLLWQLAKRIGKYVIMYLFPISILFFYWDEIMGFFAKLGKGIVSKISGAWDAIKGGFNGLVNWFRTLPGRISKALSGISEAISSKFDVVTKYGNRIAKYFGLGNSKHVIEGRAIGGPVRRGEPYIVGERGPELFVPSGSGNIVPSDSLRTSSNPRPVRSRDERGKSISISLTINADSMSSIEKIKQAAMDGVSDALRQAGLNLGIDLDEVTA